MASNYPTEFSEQELLNFVYDLTLKSLGVHLTSAIAGENIIDNVLHTRQSNSGVVCTADAAIKSGAGFVHSITFAQNDAAPTAGSIIIYDNTAESGTILLTTTWTTAVFSPVTIHLNQNFGTGLYIGFTTTADISVNVSYS